MMLKKTLITAATALVATLAVGAHGNTFDLVLGAVIGGIGYLLRVMNFPIAPFILGFVLGDMMGQNLRRALSISEARSACCSPARSRLACG